MTCCSSTFYNHYLGCRTQSSQMRPTSTIVLFRRLHVTGEAPYGGNARWGETLSPHQHRAFQDICMPDSRSRCTSRTVRPLFLPKRPVQLVPQSPIGSFLSDRGDYQMVGGVDREIKSRESSGEVNRVSAGR